MLTNKKGKVFVSANLQGDFLGLDKWCFENNTSTDDILILCGDSKILYFMNNAEEKNKYFLSKLPITLLCVRGEQDENYLKCLNICYTELDHDPISGGVYWEKDYPNILYVANGTQLNLKGKNCLFLEGGHDTEQQYYPLGGRSVFSDEMPSPGERMEVLDKVYRKHYDYVFSHTCPAEWADRIGPMEIYLDDVRNYISFSYWFYGHFCKNEIKKLDGNQAQQVCFPYVEEIL